MRTLSVLLLLGFLSLSLKTEAQSRPLQFKKRDFRTERIAPGLKLNELRGTDLFATPQCLHLLEIKPKKRRVDLVYSQEARYPTSKFAQKNKALAAVNAGFFNVKEGGSVTFLKKDQRVVTHTPPEVVERGSVVIEGAFIVRDNGRIQIESARENHLYADQDSYDDVLLSGPLLLQAGQPTQLREHDFAQKRHPRTAACLTQRGKLLLLIADGRHDEAQGLSLPELQQVLLALDCEDAVNLDGGGSSTLFADGKVVNHPSDNKKFDHRGERKVANAIIIQ